MRGVRKLLSEKFVLQFLNRRIQQQLQNCEADKANTTYHLNLTKNDLLLTDIQLDLKWGKWDKWKNHARNSEQLINNLN